MTTTAATVETFDTAAGARLVRDDGTTMAVTPAAVTAGGFLFLRTGQRVEVHADPAGIVIAVTLPGDRRWQ